MLGLPHYYRDQNSRFGFAHLSRYAGVNCDNCADGYLLVNGQCMRLVVLSPPDGVTQKYGSAFTTTSSGKRYLYTRHLADGFKYLVRSS